MHNANDDEMRIIDAKICAMLAMDRQPKPWPDPITDGSGHSEAGDAVEIADHPLDETTGCSGVVGGNVIINAVEVCLGRIGDDERTAFDGCGPVVVADTLRGRTGPWRGPWHITIQGSSELRCERDHAW